MWHGFIVYKVGANLFHFGWCCFMNLFQLKDVCRREYDRSKTESERNQAVTSEYKQVDKTAKLCWLIWAQAFVYAGWYRPSKHCSIAAYLYNRKCYLSSLILTYIWAFIQFIINHFLPLLSISRWSCYDVMLLLLPCPCFWCYSHMVR